MSLIETLVNQISLNRAKIIDDFCNVYIASRLDWFKAKPERLSRIELVEQLTPDGMSRVYSIRIKPGRIKKK